MQVYASVTEGFWYARSAEFLQQPIMQLLVWLRVPGDVIFSIGAGLLAVFVAKLWLGRAHHESVDLPTAAASRGIKG
jgi:nitric oxide reductase subunit B